MKQIFDAAMRPHQATVRKGLPWPRGGMHRQMLQLGALRQYSELYL